MAINSETTAAGVLHLILTGNQGERAEIPVEFSKAEDNKLFPKILAAPKFTSWANSYIPRSQQRLQLQKLTFQVVEEVDGHIGFIKFHADVIRTPERTQVGGTIILNGPSVGILVVFRLNPDGVSGSENNPVLRPDDPNSQTGGQRPREYVLFVKQARPAVGAPEHREMPGGHIAPDGSFVGPAAEAILQLTGISFHEHFLEDMTSLSLSAKRTPSRSLGVSLAPAGLDERVRLYLYRESVTKEFIEKLQKKKVNDPSDVSLDLWSLNDAWRITSDAKTLSALFLFHELRYHSLMPKYRAPRESKKPPLYTAVNDLNPNLTGRNLKVKVVEPIQMVKREDRPGSERGLVVVGDATGIVKLALDPSKSSAVPELAVKGSLIYLRNIQYDMTDDHMIVILDSFGKVTAAPAEEAHLFNFTPHLENDVSSTEYEKIVPADDAYTSPPRSYGRSDRGSYRGGRGGRGSNRGRGFYY